jgi:hypothetical protein
MRYAVQRARGVSSTNKKPIARWDRSSAGDRPHYPALTDLSSSALQKETLYHQQIIDPIEKASKRAGREADTGAGSEISGVDKPGKADVIVGGNRDLLALEKVGEIPILSAAQFLATFGERRDRVLE